MNEQQTGPLVSTEMADALQDTDTLGVLAVLDKAITAGDEKVVRYCAQVLKARLEEARDLGVI